MQHTYTNQNKLLANIEEQKGLNESSLKLLQNKRTSDLNDLQLEVYFYSDDESKLIALSEYLKNDDYHSDEVEESSSEGEYFLSSFAPPISADIEKLNELTEYLCRISYKYDCEFSGWEAAVQ
ncbi:MAG: ribonuclease E inhibitor RraB [Chitinophagaceae bacterium]|nr:ribonuclease E inhibitor RraB [Chitinophagaceae bacterium]